MSHPRKWTCRRSCSLPEAGYHPAVLHRFLVACAIACALAVILDASQEPTPRTPSDSHSAKKDDKSEEKKPPPGKGGVSSPNDDPFPSTYQIPQSKPYVIRNVTGITAAGPSIRGGSVLVQDGKIAAVGTEVDAPGEAVVIDGAGKYLTPGVIDVHSHLGVYPAPAVSALSDGNEM